MGLSGLFGKRNISKIDIDIELPEEMYANRPAPVKVKLRNRKRFLSGFLLRVVAREGKALFPFVDAGAEATKYLTLSFERRGRFVVQDVHVCSVFPFNFFIRCRDTGKRFEYIVFPEPKKCELPGSLGRVKRSRGEIPSDKIGYDSETISIRDYVQGDPLKYISWKATAKTGELKTKELSSLSDQPVVIDFDAVPARNREERISFVTYTVLHLLKKNILVGLKINQRLYKPGISAAHKISLLRELALYGAEN